MSGELMARPASERVRDALKYLVIARQADADPAVGLVYLRGLEDVDPALVERACEALGKEPREDYKPALPELGTIRERCTQLAQLDAERDAEFKLLPLPADAHDDPRSFVYCLQCRDESSGLREFWCCGAAQFADRDSRSPYDTLTQHSERAYCGRKFPHAPHPYRERCGCYETNPIIARRREAQQRRKAVAS